MIKIIYKINYKKRLQKVNLYSLAHVCIVDFVLHENFIVVLHIQDVFVITNQVNSERKRDMGTKLPYSIPPIQKPGVKR